MKRHDEAFAPAHRPRWRSSAPVDAGATTRRFQQLNNTLMLETNGPRLWDSLMAMAEIGATANGGSSRLARFRDS